MDTLSLEQNGSPAASQVFTYDRNGNVLSRTIGGTTVTYSYDAAKKNRLTSTGDGLIYTYDLAGRVITRNDSAITYNYAGTAKSFGGTGYLLDPDGFRVRKAAGTDTLFYLRGIDGSVLAEYGLGGALITRYIYAGSQIAAQVSGGATSCYIADHLGSTRRVVSISDTSTYDYWPFGAVYQQGGPGSRYQFTGLERDSESALIHTPFRLYDPYAGRFLQGDPLAALSPERSPYHYARNDPLGYVDVSGLKEEVGPPGSDDNPLNWTNRDCNCGGEVVADRADRSDAGTIITPGEALLNPVQGAPDDPTFSQRDAEEPRKPDETTSDLKPYDPANSNTSVDLQVTTAQIIPPNLFPTLQRFVPWVERFSKTLRTQAHIVPGISRFTQFTRSSLERGLQIHKAYRKDEVLKNVRIKEFYLPSGRRVDFIDFEKRIIYELKPFNPPSINAGLRQLEIYLKEVESIFGPGWKTVLDTY